MVSAAYVFANQGEWIQPYVLDHVRDKKGKIIKEIKDNDGSLVQKFGTGLRSRVVDATVSELNKEYLISVTQPGGTAE